MSEKKPIVKLLDPEHFFIQVDILFAREYGLNEATLAGKLKRLQEKLTGKVDKNGEKWVRLTLNEWSNEVPLKERTIQRTIEKLVTQEIFFQRTFEGRSKWYRLNPEYVQVQIDNATRQYGNLQLDNMAGSTGQNGKLPRVLPIQNSITTTTSESTLLYFEEKYGPLKGAKNERRRVDYLDTVKEYSSEWVSRALDRAWIDRQDGPNWSPSWGYIKGILKNWQAAGGPDNEKRNQTNGKTRPNNSKIKSEKQNPRTDDTSAEILRELEKHGIDPATVGM